MHHASNTGPSELLPSVLGRSAVVRTSPSYSLRPRGGDSPGSARRAESPGPGAYAVASLIGHSALSTVRSPPAFTLRPRTGGAPGGGSPASPSPLSYSPDASQTQRAAPAFSIARRLPSPRRVTDTVGPGAYDVVSITGMGSKGVLGSTPSAPSFSLRARVVDAGEAARARSPSPSPVDYDLPSAMGPSFVHHSNGAFSMRGRPPTRSPRAASPGPAAYGVPSGVGPQAASTRVSAPSWGFSTGERGRSARGSPSPGPAAYDVPSAFRPLSPGRPEGISIKGRLTVGSPVDAGLRNASPGPAAYNRGDVTVLTTHMAVRTPGLSRGERMSPTPAERAARSGPTTHLAHIDLNKVQHAAPSFSMRSRHTVATKAAEMNGPAAYNLQREGMRSATKRGSPSWTLKARWGAASKDNGVPGPGAYGALELPFFDAAMARTGKVRSAAGGMRAPGGGSPLSAHTSLLSVSHSLAPPRSPSAARFRHSGGGGGGGGSGGSPSSRASSPSHALRFSQGPSLAALIGASE